MAANLKIYIMALTLLMIFPLYSENSMGGTFAMLEEAAFYENYEIRDSQRETIFAPFLTVLNTPKRVYEQRSAPVSVRFEVRKSAEYFYLLFLNEYQYSYPVWGRGSYIIKRDIRTGGFLQLKIFLQNDEGSYLRLFPEGNRTRMDIYLFGSRVYKGILLPVDFKRILISPFSILVNLSADSVDWEALFTNVNWPEWERVSRMGSQIRSKLDLIEEVDDGAQNHFGEFVFIEDESRQKDLLGLNCSGFTKWIGDGIYSFGNTEDSFGPYMDIERLKASNYEISGIDNSWSENNMDRDPYFGLDWVRNMASALFEKRLGLESGLRDHDVRSTPWFHYSEDVGYPLSDLSAVLYLQAIKNPGAIYFGAISTEFGTAPILRQYRHVSAFFPWFTKDGNFHLSIFDTGTEKNALELENQFPGGFVQFVKIEGVEGLSLPPIE